MNIDELTGYVDDVLTSSSRQTSCHKLRTNEGVRQYCKSAHVQPAVGFSLLCSDMYCQSGPLDKGLSTISVQALEWSILVSFQLLQDGEAYRSLVWILKCLARSLFLANAFLQPLKAQTKGRIVGSCPGSTLLESLTSCVSELMSSLSLSSSSSSSLMREGREGSSIWSRSSKRAGSRNWRSKEENMESGKWEVGGVGDMRELRVDEVEDVLRSGRGGNGSRLEGGS